MGLETVVEDIREEARQRADEIREEADEAAAALIEDAETEAESILDQRERTVERRIEQEREQAHSSAKLAAKQERLAARRDMLAELRSDVEDRIRELEGERRAELTAVLLADAVSEFSADAPLSVTGAAADADMLTELTKEHENAEFDGTIDCLGGVVVGSDESRVTIDNTFDAILDQMWDDNLKRLSARLFDQDQ